MVDRVRNISSWRQELGAELDRNKNETNHMMRTRYFRGSDIQHLSRYYYCSGSSWSTLSRRRRSP